MALQVKVGQNFYIGSDSYMIAEHPAIPGQPYGQEGKAATVFKLYTANGSAKALKVFKRKYQDPTIVDSSSSLRRFSSIEGFKVCHRTVIVPTTHQSLISQYPDLKYAVIMPWIEGRTWFDVILERKEISQKESFNIARKFLELLVSMEQKKLAHCDLSGANVILSLLDGGDSIEFVDVEQLYAPGIEHPAKLATGTPGYVHPNTPQDYWAKDADRFPGAVLLVEMLSWFDDRIRNMADEESYFAPNEVGKNSKRYQILQEVLQETYGGAISELFQQIWFSSSNNQCPTFNEWFIALTNEQPQVTESESFSVTYEPPVLVSSSPPSTINTHTVPKSTEIMPDIRRTTVIINSNTDDISRNKNILKFAGIFIVVGIVFAYLIAQNATILTNIYAAVKVYGTAVADGIGSGILALLIGLIELWIFQQRMPQNKKLIFVLLTAASGIIGGAIGGGLVDARVITVHQIGFVVGILSGALTSFGYIFLMRTMGSNYRWLIWNTAAWAISWYTGWTVGLFIESNNGGWMGSAVSAGLITILLGVFLTLYIWLTPDFEF